MARALKNVTIHPRIRIEEQGGVSFAVSCRHCGEPLCAKSCITGAISIEDGVVAIDGDKCVGCYTCVMVCPYGAVSPGENGAVQKCELCFKNTTGAPACVAGCPNRAIVFEEREA
jgi:carbon-monoxide dehydrogenase iron sulfur subunit